MMLYKKKSNIKANNWKRDKKYVKKYYLFRDNRIDEKKEFKTGN